MLVSAIIFLPVTKTYNYFNNVKYKNVFDVQIMGMELWYVDWTLLFVPSELLQDQEV